MQFIKDFFDFVINTVTSVWSFFTGLIEDLTLFISYLGSAFRLATQCILYLPPWLQVFGTITLGVCMIYLIVGRDTGKGA